VWLCARSPRPGLISFIYALYAIEYGRRAAGGPPPAPGLYFNLYL
jgi:hypothetical protein